ncbi:hypothetical protein TPHA_0G02730 [Tetrapisispora phaffii CBS 4417]|uniref:Defect at low temperature protein 1 n=1 Tax=Tetrapisispora phaffii (strain ATCC 24235 / CBS 4417 / NBRC 1672 / NRRL Y-8282 / UCD 70-5) TaxID=1071381 RepID=G8BW32_TETPH|nr:hypothetical protein TPHA_0G02730 [Tetrapisispora phaffii CBS 4417]CCE64110.1 hypothetical protein TPHA_0G02730 [Tetrapisispora phaffii CBS 4417]
MPQNSPIIIWAIRILYSINYILLVGFAAVLPIDCIAQASRSLNNALNTFIVVGALVVFAIVCIVIVAGRSLYFRSCLQDIPRGYIPLSAADLPHSASRKLVIANMTYSKDLGLIFKQPQDPVIHPGIEPPLRCDDPSVEKLFPENLNYELCIKNISDRVKFKGQFLNLNIKRVPAFFTFEDVVKYEFITDSHDPITIEKAQRLISLYETLRYSGRAITREDFQEFMELCFYLMETTLLQDKDNIDISKLHSKISNTFDQLSREDTQSFTSEDKPNETMAQHMTSLKSIISKTATQSSKNNDTVIASKKSKLSLVSASSKNGISDVKSFDSVIRH